MESLLTYLPDLQTLGALAYPFVFVIVFLESLIFTGVFVPGATATVLLGALAAHGYYEMWILVLMTFLGSFVGDAVSFELGYKHRHIADKRPWLIRSIPRVERFFEKFGSAGIIFGRFFGWTRPFIPFVAGMVHYPRERFYIICTASCLLWAIGYLGIGYLFGTAWRAAMHWSAWAVLGVVALAGVFWLMVQLWKYFLLLGKKRALEIAREKIEEVKEIIPSSERSSRK